MAKSKKKRKHSAASLEEKAALRQQKAEYTAKQNRRGALLLMLFIITGALLIALLIASFSTTSSENFTVHQYNQLKSGLSYTRVVDIMGREGQQVSDSNADGSITYQWTNKDGSFISVTMQDEQLVSFNQSGLSD